MEKRYNLYTYRTANTENKMEMWEICFSKMAKEKTKEEIKARIEKAKTAKSKTENMRMLVFEVNSEEEKAFLETVKKNKENIEKHNKKLEKYLTEKRNRRFAEMNEMYKKGYVVRDAIAYIHK